MNRSLTSWNRKQVFPDAIFFILVMSQWFLAGWSVVGAALYFRLFNANRTCSRECVRLRLRVHARVGPLQGIVTPTCLRCRAHFFRTKSKLVQFLFGWATAASAGRGGTTSFTP